MKRDVFDHLEQVTGIEPALQPWEGRVLPLNHTCFAFLFYHKELDSSQQ